MPKLKPIELKVYKTNEILGVFNSTKYIVENSEILFGIKINEGHMSDVALGKRKSHLGLAIKYISEEEYNKRKNNEEPELKLIYKIKKYDKNINCSRVKNSEINTYNLPKKNWNGKIVVDWINTKGYDLHIIYKCKNYILNILDSYRENGETFLILKYNKKVQKFSLSAVLCCNFGELLGLSKTNGNHKYEFKYNIGDVIDNLIITDTKRINDGRYYKYKCKKCGFDCGEYYNLKSEKYEKEHWILEHNLLKGKRCICCANKIVVKGINDIATTNPEFIKYFENIEDAYKHTYASGKKILCKCPNCGYEKESDAHSLSGKGFSCPRCGDGISYPNKFMFNLLEQLNINFKSEYCPQWVNKSKYDFYLPDNNIIIEMDGAFHYKDNNMNGQTKEHSKQIDYYKDKIAKEHGIKVIRIDCNYTFENKFEYVKNNIINSKLNDLFDLNNIDWNKINYNSTVNTLMIKICKLKHDNPNLTSSQISELLKPQNSCSKSTIIKWLRLGKELGLCAYDTDEESRIKFVEVFKNKESLGIFKTNRCLSEQSEKLFGIKFNTQGISKACLCNKPYKNFTFKYITKEEYEQRKNKEDPTIHKIN